MWPYIHSSCTPLLSKALLNGSIHKGDIVTNKIKSARNRRYKAKPTPEERSERAKRAAKTRKLAQVPLDVTINGVKLKGYYPVHRGEISTDHLYLNNYKMIQKKLSGLLMRTTLRTSDDYSRDAEESYGVRDPFTPLGEVPIFGSNRGLPPIQIQKEKNKYVLKVSSAGAMYRSVEPLKVTIKKTAVPEPFDFGQMAASMKPTALMAAVQSLLNDDELISASVAASEKRVNLSRPLYNDRDCRLAVCVASKGHPLADLPLDLQASAEEGLRKIRALAAKHGISAEKLYDCIVAKFKAADARQAKEAAQLADFVQRTMGSSTLKVTGVDLDSIPGYIIVNTNVTDSDGASFSPDTLKRLLKSNDANSLNVGKKGLVSFHYQAQSGVSASTVEAASDQGATFARLVKQVMGSEVKIVEVIDDEDIYDESATLTVVTKISSPNGEAYVSKDAMKRLAKDPSFDMVTISKAGINFVFHKNQSVGASKR